MRWFDGRAVRYSLVGIIVLFGVSVRLSGIRLGLPFHHHWDEGWVVDSAVAMFRAGNDVPLSYQYGAPLARLTEASFWILRCAQGESPRVTDMDAQVTFYLLARVVTALISSTGVVAMYIVGRYSAGPPRPRATLVGLGSALLYAVASELVMHARYAVTDACLAGLTAWTLAFTALYVSTRKLAWALASVLAAALTFAFKIPGITAAILPVTALLLVRWPPTSGRSIARRALLIVALPVILASYIAFNPHLLDRTAEAMLEIVARLKQTRDGPASKIYLRQPGFDHLAAALYAIGADFLHRRVGLSLLLSAVSVWGVAIGIARRLPVVAIGLLHAVTVTLAIALFNRVFWIRNYLVVTPFLCLGFGLGIVATFEWLSSRRGASATTATVALGALLTAALIALPLHDAIGAERLNKDPRDRGIRWIAAREGYEGVDVALTSTVLGKRAMSRYGQLEEALKRPNVRFVSTELEACPSPQGGPQYIVDASYWDVSKSAPSNPYAPLWLFEECPGYTAVARFGPNPYEHSLRETPNWYGSVDVVVLQREPAPARNGQ